MILEKRRLKKPTLVYISGAEVEQVNTFRVSTSQTVYLGYNTSPPWKKKERIEKYLLPKEIKKPKFRNQFVGRKYYRRAIESILTGNMTSWHGLCMAKESEALQRMIETTKNITGTIYGASVK